MQMQSHKTKIFIDFPLFSSAMNRFRYKKAVRGDSSVERNAICQTGLHMVKSALSDLSFVTNFRNCYSQTDVRWIRNIGDLPRR